MLVFFKKHLYSLEMDFDTFKNLREKVPEQEVEILSITNSTYKVKPISVKIGELNDCSFCAN